MTLPVFKDHNPSNPWVVTNESHVVASNGTVELVYAPKKGTIAVPGFAETIVESPGFNEFYCDYQDATEYRTASQIVQFSLSQAGNTVVFAYSGVSQTVMARHMNELKDHEENSGIHLTTTQATKIGESLTSTKTLTATDATIPTSLSATPIGHFTAIYSMIKAITGNATGIIAPVASLLSLWNLKWTEKFILFNPADLYVSPGIPLSRDGTMATMDFYVTGTPTAATVITVKRNGIALTPTVSLSAAGKTTLTFGTAVTGTADDLFSYSVAGGGLSVCTVVANGKWVNR